MEHNIDNKNDTREEYQRDISSGTDRYLFYQRVSHVLSQATNIDDGVNEVLALIGEKFKVSRVYVFENSQENEGYCNNTFEWCGEGVRKEIDNLQNLFLADYGYDVLFEKNQCFCCSDTGTLDDYLREFLQAQGIKSMLNYAFYSNGKMCGFVGIDDCENSEPEWIDNIELRETIVFIADLLTMYLIKERNLQKAQIAEARLRETSQIMEALNEDFVNIYLVNVRKRSVVVRKQTGLYYIEDDDEGLREFDYDGVWQKYISEAVHPEDAEALYNARHLETVLEKLKTQKEYTFNYRTINHGLRSFQFKFAKLSGDDDVIVAGFRNVDSVIQQEAEHKRQLEDALENTRMAAEQNQEFLELVNELVSSGMWYLYLDETGHHTEIHWSNTFRRLLGYDSEDEFPNTLEAWISRLHPEEKDKILAEFSNGIQSKNEYNYKYRMMTKSGRYEMFISRGKLARFVDGKPRLFFGTLTNITAQETEMADINGRLDAMLGGVNGGLKISRNEPKYPYVYISESVAAIQGYTPEELMIASGGTAVTNGKPEDVALIAGQMMADFTATGTYSAKYRVRHKNGRWIWIHDYGTLVRTPQGEELVYSLIQNIDAEERLTKQLVTERQNYQDALTKGSMYHYTVDLTDGYYRREIYSHDGLPMFESLGVALPAAYNDQASLFIGMGFEPLDSMGELAASREKILELFESGCTQFEYHIRYSVDDTYSRVMVLMHRTEEKGHVIATFIHHDETEQKRAENMRLKQERLTTEIIHALSGDYENVYIVNTEDMTVDVRKIGGEPFSNAPYGQATLFPYDESWRHYIDMFVHPDDAEALYEARNIDRVIEKLETGSEYTYTFRTIRSKMRYLQFKFIRLDEKRIIAGLRNISSIVEEENKQRELLEDALRSAEHANRSKTIFLSSMSHDIRTPMNAIIGFTSLALNNISDSDRVRDYLQKIQTSSKHLHALFDEVLDMSRIDSGKVTIEESQVNLPELVQSVYDIVQADIRSKNLSVSVLGENIRDENVWCDRLRLNQILINCVSNAIKYTPPYGAVTVSIDQLESEKNGYALYEFRVRDTGIGMSKEFIEHIYEPFTREQTSTVSGIPGTGLGMTISKRFVDMMGGTIEVKSEKNVGTEFIIRVSFRIVTSEAVTNPIMQLSAAPEENSKGIQGLRILLVEDNELNREIASEILKEQGAFIEMAGDGSAAVDIIINSKAGQFDLILMDIQMPIMNGYEATRRIRAMPDREKADIPIIALSANAFEEDRRKSMEEGANAHIPKPINVEELTEVIKRVLKK